MRCLIVADLHYSLPQFDWVLNVADQYDLVILAGDHLDLSSAVPGSAQIVVVRKYVEMLAAKTRVILCSGNHDLDSRNSEGEKVAKWLDQFREVGVPTDGDSVQIEDTLFTLCPWWDGPLTRDRIALQLAADAAIEKRRWVWIHHAPADRSPTSWTGSKHFGDGALSGWIAQHNPTLVFSGHIHQSPFVKDGSWVDRIKDTWLFNVGQHSGALPAHIIIDLARDEAVWLSLAGIQSVKLNEDLLRPVQNLPTAPDWIRDRAGGPSPAQTPAAGD